MSARSQTAALADDPDPSSRRSKSRRSKSRRSKSQPEEADELGDRFVYGVAARSQGLFSEVGTGIKDITWGGKSSWTENKYEKAIEAAVGKLLKKARGRPIGPINVRTDAEHTKGDMVVVIAYANLL